jgi:uncharacterized membrane protein YphA (DoxX/SURF4 family)
MDHQIKKLTSVVAILSIQLTLIYMWVLAGVVKFIDPDYQANFPKRFEGTLLESLPGGVPVQMYTIGLIELVAALLAAIGLLRLEALRGSARWTQLSLAVSALTFAMLGFGLRLIKDFAGSANIYFYLAGTIVFMIYIDRAVSDRRSSGPDGGRFRGGRRGGGGQGGRGPRSGQSQDQGQSQRQGQGNRSNNGPRPVTSPKPNAN